MKSFILLFCTTMFSFTTSPLLSQNSNIIIDKDKTVTVDEIFKMISDQTDYKFIYQSDLFRDFPEIHLSKGVIKANELLRRSILSKNLEFQFSRKKTIIIKKKSPMNANPLELAQQEIQIKGKVIDQNNIPLPGATIIEKGTNNGTLTDFDGNFSFTVTTEKPIIQISYLGYKTIEIEANPNIQMDIKLESATSSLDEVVLVGYGSKKREEVSSAISTVSNKALVENSVGVTSFDRSLAGLVKGVNVKTNSGAPGAGIDINIRGYTSPFSGSDNNPLFVIDGVPFQSNPTIIHSDETTFTEVQNPLLSINPNDIESIDVLKDAAATAIYGSRGANGVIIVNTKKGKKNEAISIYLSTSLTMSTPIKIQDYLNAAEYKNYLDTYFKNTFEAADKGLVPTTILNNFSDMYVLNSDNSYAGLKESFFGSADTDWNNAVYRNPAYSKNYNLSIRGGSEKTSYFVSSGYTDQEGIVKNDTFKDYSVRLGIDTRISKVFDMGTNINLGYSNRDRGQDFGDFYDMNLNARPDFPVFDENGNVTRIPSVLGAGLVGTNSSPYATATLQSNTTKAYNVLGNYYLKATVNKNFNLKASFNGSYMTTNSYYYSPSSIVGLELPAYGYILSSADSFAYDMDAINTNLVTDFTANYTNTFGEHTVDMLVGYSLLRNSTDKSFTYLQGFPDDYVLTNPSNANSSSMDASTIESGLNSFFTRVAYNYNFKYFITTTLRMDKSSKFAPGNKEAFFPSLAASWNVTKESFLENSKTIDLLRLRASIGRTGSTNLGDFVFLQGFSVGFREDGLYNGGSAIGLGNKLANENASWETTEEVNIGLDFGFLNNRLKGNIDLYNRKTTGALVNTPIPLEGGLQNFTSNFIDLTNKGFEFELGGDILKSDELAWYASVNISKNINKIDKLTATQGSNVNSPYEVGKEINLIRGYVVEGIYQTQSEIDNLNAGSPTGTYSTIGKVGPGDYKYADVNGDGELTIEDSYGIIGSSQPDFFGGFNSSISYKSFELAAYFSFSKGAEFEVYDEVLNPNPNYNNIERFNVQNRWSPTNTEATLPQLVYRGYDDVNDLTSTANLYDGSFIRLKNIQLSCDLPPSIIDRLSIKGASVYLAGSNLFTWTDFPGLDPENGYGSADTYQGSGVAYPNSKSWSLGINFNF